LKIMAMHALIAAQVTMCLESQALIT